MIAVIEQAERPSSGTSCLCLLRAAGVPPPGSECRVQRRLAACGRSVGSGGGNA